jgi:hypothetical protein
MNILTIFNFLNGKKTYIICLGSLITVLIAWLNGQENNQQAIQQAIALVLAATIRHGITTENNK